jgi:hypothetical protein
METISSNSKVWRVESTPHRKLASAMWRRAKALGVPVRGRVEGSQCRVEMLADGNTAWQVVNDARNLLQYQPSAATPSPVSDAGYSDASFAGDTPILANDERALESHDAVFITGIYDAARAAGFNADWCRVSGRGNRWRVEVWGATEPEFRALLDVSGRGVAIAA